LLLRFAVTSSRILLLLLDWPGSTRVRLHNNILRWWFRVRRRGRKNRLARFGAIDQPLAEGAALVQLQPLIGAVLVEVVVAGKDPDIHASLVVIETDSTPAQCMKTWYFTAEE
jgi:hypothetical protein